MFESVILLLIYIVLLVGLAYVVLWVLAQIGVALPPMAIKCFWIVIALCVLLLLYRMVGPALSGGHLPGLR